MAVDHALRFAGGPRGVAHSRRIALIDLRPGIAGGTAAEEVLIGQHRLELAIGRRAIRHDDEVLYPFDVVGDPLQGRQDRGVDENHRVLGIVDHVLQVLREEPGIQRMQDGSGTGDREIQLQMPVVVPCQGADPVASTDAELLQGMGQLRHPLTELGVGVPMPTGFASRHDLLGRKQRRRPPQKVLQRQREVGHCASHRVDPPSAERTRPPYFWPSQYHP